ncbi:hypothetical protein A3A76_01035 [Candidatus Woesebacteria bacterium RIFCSPLOWO2_01_FULL_39_23]|uniref:DUF6922 domain-containing protein n=1 Tax=Candidatus Woesebacteria bacterium RIFCSPHIGHO2_01_FULL_40_22 TaxID=1802499 RepID=A0A1F7YHK9_9BACT|nr:MAG: hypothetical protein A2141_05680 [Candidatus Woesebacteria bacterium RBG_16_40_11]OGM26826.1 MAG: hypothetical protein A2628_04710 [Candidatus Woesebacteria bacterium RIFCSPHIGHO2_01_FULL_40_22]OGM38214.1 MAG: hypothetical protein A3E41_02395 [Candidatus Woesebacteria bacterium RIFCSPHIGHO2_12_FULL_38_9]OGM63123.1 MAG: hypothetical protein A3A76_01035 [Candidatus Woesebacteria bacterium RIFCSPLOWO2_01_FULL_39_23]
MHNIPTPEGLQAVLWSKKLNNIDINKDKNYIINQVLAYGLIEHIQWLFKVYSRNTIIETFLENPSKIYSDKALNFIKFILFENNPVNLDEKKYVRYPL